jgi:hypothetical protein
MVSYSHFRISQLNYLHWINANRHIKEIKMAITKQTVVDQITVTENGIILCRAATRIIEDGNVLTNTYHRTSLTPGQDLTGQPEKVVAIAQAAWTADVIAAYQAQHETNSPAPTATPEPTPTPTQEPAAP